jgi:hypothetical protein
VPHHPGGETFREILDMKIARGAHGVLHLLTEPGEGSKIRRAVRLEATVNGNLLLTDADLRSPPTRAWRFAIPLAGGLSTRSGATASRLRRPVPEHLFAARSAEPSWSNSLPVAAGLMHPHGSMAGAAAGPGTLPTFSIPYQRASIGDGPRTACD